MKIKKNKFLYLISPNKIFKSFYIDLKKVLKSDKVAFFQLRLKKESFENKIKIAKKIKKICKDFKVKFLINDDPKLANQINADGCHLGQNDMAINNARKLLKKKIIGVTCHNSMRLAKIAIKNNADYLAFGAFNISKTKILISSVIGFTPTMLLFSYFGSYASNLIELKTFTFPSIFSPEILITIGLFIFLIVIRIYFKK